MYRWMVLVVLAVGLAACAGESGSTPSTTGPAPTITIPPATTTTTPPPVTITVPPLAGSPGMPDEIPPLPELDPNVVNAGRVLYVTHCSECHGVDLKGDPEWMKVNEDGTYPPPPQDETGHTWHHPDGLLVSVIRDGSEFATSVMPEFGDILTDAEIVSILDYLKSGWPEDIRVFQWEQTVRELYGG